MQKFYTERFNLIIFVHAEIGMNAYVHTYT